VQIRLPLFAVVAVLSLSSLSSVALAQSPTTTGLTVTPSALAEGLSATLSATVTPSSGSAPSGSVGFYYQTTHLASAPLNAEGVASVTLSSANVTPGTYSITAKYAGNASDAASTSSPVSATVLPTTTTRLTSPASAYLLGQSATLTATVSSTFPGTPTGTVRFYYGTFLLGSATLNAGSASITEPIPTDYETGTYVVTAKYSGDANYGASSGSFTLSLDKHFTITSGAGVQSASTVQLTLTPNPGGTQSWQVNGIIGGNSSIGTISSTGLYTAPAVTSPLKVTVVASSTTQAGYYTPAAAVYVIPKAVVAETANGQVASYTIDLPADSSVSAQFGTSTAYGLNTWTLTAPTGGGSTQLLIVGMLADTLYHIQGLVSLPGGLSYPAPDATFTTTASLPTSSIPKVTVTSIHLTPSPGVEFLDRLSTGANIVDLDGNFLWGYPTVGSSAVDVQPFKLMSNGHLLITQSPSSSYAIDGTILPEGTPIEVQEVDYANNIIRTLDLATLQTNLNASGYLNQGGQQITLTNIHHDTTINPVTGHWIVISNALEFITGLPGYPKGVNVLGDVIIDVDPNNGFAVDWVWNEFDHLDIDRQPMGFPDWTHTNAITYSSSDHNILISIRHQNWVVKVDYDDAAGDGSILWHLGYQGDFALVGGTSPQDWQYAQHDPAFTTANTTGTFGLILMDNGNDRIFPTGFTCPVALTNNVCLYSRAPLFTINDSAMTATLSNPQLSPVYSYFGGNAERLSNGNIEQDLCNNPTTPGLTQALIQESTLGSNPQLVLQMAVVNNQYRAFREPSPYPGVTWSAAALRLQAAHATHPAQQ
jgi:arylsulfate sulfotransferase